MVSSVEFQISGAKFTDVILETLRDDTTALPGPVQGWQVQRIRADAVRLRNDEKGPFSATWSMGLHSGGTHTDYEANLVLMDVDIRVEVNQPSTIAAHPNTMPAPELNIAATVTVELRGVFVGSEPAIRFDLHAVSAPTATLLGIDDVSAWARATLDPVFSSRPIVVPLKSLLAPGVSFDNVGLALNSDVTVLALRAAAPTAPGADPYFQWRSFHDGGFVPHLGSADWALSLVGDDLEIQLQTALGSELRKALGWRLITLEVHYVALGSTARFVVTPWIKVGSVVGTVSTPINVDVSYDVAKGLVTLDIDAYGVRDLVADAEIVLATVLSFALPVWGSFIAGSVIGALGKAEWLGTFAAAALAPGSIKVDVVGDRPFHWRASVPFTAPKLTIGSVTSVAADASALAIQGKWAVRSPAPGDLSIHVGDLVWVLGGISCGPNAKALLDRIREDPASIARLYASIDLSMTTAQRARIVDVVVLNPADLSDVPAITMSSAYLPASIHLSASGHLADGHAAAVELEVRTTQGAFRASVLIPPPPGEAEVEYLLGLLQARLAWCDSISLPDGFHGEARFDLDWIVDPLIDPDRDDVERFIELFEVNVDGAKVGAVIEIAQESAHTTITASREAATLTVAASAGNLGRTISMQLPATPRMRSRPRFAGSFAVERTMLERVSATALTAAPVSSVLRTSAAGRELLVLDATEVTAWHVEAERLVRGTSWPVDHATGITANGEDAFVFGEYGIRRLDETLCGCGQLLQDPVDAAAAGHRRVFVATGTRLRALTSDGSSIAEQPLEAPVTGMVVVGDELLTTSARGFIAWSLSSELGFVQHQVGTALADATLLTSEIGDGVLARHPDGTVTSLDHEGTSWVVAQADSDDWRTRLFDLGPVVLRQDRNEIAVLARRAAAPLAEGR